MLGSVSIYITGFPHKEFCTNCSTRIAEDGFCSKDDGSSQTGAKVTTAISLELWLEVNADWGDDGKLPVFSHRLFNLTDTLDEECWPVPIPGLLKGQSQGDSALLPIPTGLIPSASDDSKSTPPVAPSKPHNHPRLTDLLYNYCEHHCCDLGPDACLDNAWNSTFKGVS